MSDLVALGVPRDVAPTGGLVTEKIARQHKSGRHRLRVRGQSTLILTGMKLNSSFGMLYFQP